MKNQNICIFFALVYIAVLGACFSPWDGSGGDKNLKYTVTLVDSDGKPIGVESTQTTPIVITVPQGEWAIEVKADALQDDDFAATRQRFVGGAKVKVSAKEEKITLSISEMTPAIQVENWSQVSNAFEGGWDAYLEGINWKPKSDSPEYYIEIIGDNLSAGKTTTLNADKNIVLWTKKKVTITRGTGGSLFKIDNGTLTLGRDEPGQGDITIAGNDNTDNNSLITVSGTLIMYDKVTLTENTASGNTGNNNNGGGVFVANGGRFFMEGGTISDNVSDPKNMPGDNAGGGGGVYVDSGGEFTMNDGMISGNRTTGHGGGVRVYGKSKDVDKDGIFTMNGGTIYDNKVVTNNSEDNGGGVRVRGIFIMTSGTISVNKAPSGGGVSIADSGNGTGTFTMNGGTISGNTATSNSGGRGGGVRLFPGGIFVKEGGTIYGNDAPDSDLRNTAGEGHAVYAEKNKNVIRLDDTQNGTLDL
jgi:hypothetical protein